MEVKPIDSVAFTDGTTRPVYIDLDGRQYVHADDGEAVWILLDEPEVIERETLAL